jgi:hypothetical protein
LGKAEEFTFISNELIENCKGDNIENEALIKNLKDLNSN